MDATQISQLISTVGFPIVAAIILWRFMKDRMSATEERGIQRELEMSARINHLEDMIEKDLTILIKQQGSIIQECTTALRDSHAVINSIRENG